MRAQLAPFVEKMRASGYIPLPGDVDIIMGGPPCQGVSGLNRHGKTKQIIDDPRCERRLHPLAIICFRTKPVIQMSRQTLISPYGEHCFSKVPAFPERLPFQQASMLGWHIESCRDMPFLWSPVPSKLLLLVCRNRQVLAFYKTIEWFQPSYVLMENVLDIFKKGDGLYAKMAATTLLNLDYQTRTGVIAAAHHGCPQGRWR